ncbi:MAG: [protein-PII] uridylyltransferase family protein, partial [Desulforhopalus sp.]
MITEFRAERKGFEKIWAEGLSGDDVLRSHSRLVDSYIVDCFQNSQVNGCGDDVAFVALGGYGREELFPFSDIDLMILYRPRLKKRIGKIADAVLYPLWDTGMEVGHGVRTIAESMRHAKEDYFFLVALLDARLVHGSQKVFADLIATYRKRFVDGYRDRFVAKMKSHRQSRRERFGSHSFLLEPHIKEGRGGMRDLQAMMWTARVVFGLKGFGDIQAAGLLLEDEYKEFLAARDMLVRLRSHLHYTAKRKNDQLYFEQQEDVAESFGYKAEGELRGVELFMRDVYKALHTISVTTDLFFDHVDEVLGLATKRGGVADRVIEKGIEIKSESIHLTATKDQLDMKPQTLVRLFLAMSRTGLKLHHRTRKVIPGYLGLLTEKDRTSPRLAKTLFTLLLEAQDIGSVLEAMLETGVLSAIFPEFRRITGLAQHDLYHIYTVDRHSLQAVAELHDVVSSWHAVAQNIKSLRVLYLAALLHDIGKGSGRDHSLEGAELAGKIGRRLQLSDEECTDLEFLIAFHLFMPENALRRDLNDAVFIKRCAETIGNLNRLSMLYL